MTGDDPTPGEAADRFAAIAALEASIERDHRALEDMISAPGQAADDSLHDNPELRAIADRLTKQERMLEALKSTVDAEPGPVR